LVSLFFWAKLELYMNSSIFEKLSNLSVFELMAFFATAAVMLGLVVLLPYKIIQEIKKHKQ